MIPLLRHYLIRSRPKVGLIVTLGAAAWFLLIWYLFPNQNRKDVAWAMTVIVVVFYGAMTPLLIREGEEFDLALPVRRRTIYVARCLATLTIALLIAAPVTALAWLAGAFSNSQWGALRLLANVTFFWIAMFLAVTALVRFTKRMSPQVATGVAVGLSVTAFSLLMRGPETGVQNFLPAIAALVVAAMALTLDAWHFERYELLPAGGSRLAESAAPRSRVANHLAPTVRVLAGALWLQRWYLVYAAMAVVYAFLFTYSLGSWADPLPFFCMLLVVFAALGTLQFLRSTTSALFHLVPRRTILRSALGPIAAAPAVIGGIEAIGLGSARMIVSGLALTLFVVGGTWLVLPTRREYGRPFPMGMRRAFIIILVILLAVCPLRNPAENFIGRWLLAPFSSLAQAALGEPLLASCAMLLAIELLWWRCERKFRYFEPSAFPAAWIASGEAR